MKKFVISAVMALSLATPVFAADMAVKAPPPPPPIPLFSWTGFYVGANIGGAWAHDGLHDTLFLTNFNNAGNGVFIGGGKIGGNYQIGQFVIGGEWDFDGVANNNNTGAGIFIPGVGNVAVTNKNRWITTVA